MDERTPNTETAFGGSEDRYRRLFESVRDGLLILDAEGGSIIDVNPAFEEMFGCMKEQLIGKDFRGIKIFQDIAETQKDFFERIQKPDETYKSVSARTLDGKSIIVDVFNTDYLIAGRKEIQCTFRDITEYKRAQEELSESEEKFSTAFKTSPYAITITNPETGEFIGVNDSFLSITGYTLEETLRNASLTMGLWVDENERSRVVQALFEGKIVDKQKSRFRKKNGEIMIGSFSARIILVKHHNYILSSIEDITERLEAETELRDSANTFSKMFHQSPVGIILSTPEEGRVLDANDTFLREMEFTREEVIGRSSEEIGIFADKDTRQKLVAMLREKGIIFGFECRFRSKTNKHIVGLLSVVTIKLRGQICLLSTVNDITNQKMIQEALRDKEERLRHIFEYSAACVCTVGIDGKFQEVNNAFIEVFEYSNKEIQTLHFNEITYAEDLSIGSDNFHKMLSGEIKYASFEKRYLTKTKKIIWGHVSSSLVRDNNGLPQFFITQIIDITDKKNAESAIQQNREMLIKLSDLVPGVIYQYRLFPDGSSCFPFASVGMNMIYEVTPEEVQYDATPVFGRLHPEDYDYVAETISESARTLSLFHCEFRVILPKQGLRWRLSDARPERMEDGGTLWHGIISDVTDRVEAEEKLRVSENLYKMLANNSSDVIWTMDLNGAFTYISPSVEQMRGFTVEEIMHQSFEEVISPSSQQAVLDKTRLRIESSANGVFMPTDYTEVEQPCKDGSTVWTEVVSRSLCDASGNTIGIIGVSRDISERKKAADILSKSEERFKNAFQYSAIGMALVSPEGAWLKINSQVSQIIGYTEQELLSMNFQQITHPDDLQADEGFVARMLSGEIETYSMEKRYFHKEGKIVWAFLSVSLIRDITGTPQFFISQIEDITERKLAENELRKLSRAVVQSPVSIIITDPKGNIEFVNPKFTEVTGYSAEEVKRQNPKILKSGMHTKDFYEKLWNTILSGRNWEGEFCNKKKNGEIYWDSSVMSPIVNENGDITHFVAVQEDITEKKIMIKELILAKAKAEEMSRLKSNFLANMSHELRTPLNGILGYASILSSDLEKPEHIEMANGIFLSGRRLNETLNFILDLSAAETDKFDVAAKDTEVIPLIQNSVSAFAHEAAKKGIKLDTIIHVENVYAHIDEHLFAKVLNNLLDNALKFTKKGEVCIEIGIEHSDNKEWLTIKVKDTGIGIAKDHIDLIWEEFRQVSEGMGRSYEGPGLGLTISKKAVELMEGTISVESELGKGSVFTVRFPAIQEIRVSEEPEFVEDLTRVKAAEKLSVPSALPFVLCVEDDALNRDVVELYLKSTCNLQTAESGKSALELTAVHTYDLILMDINLGEGINGMDVVKEIRKMPQYAETPIVAVTAYAMGKEKSEFLKGGCTHYIAKPFTQNELISVIKGALQNNR